MRKLVFAIMALFVIFSLLKAFSLTGFEDELVRAENRTEAAKIDLQ